MDKEEFELDKKKLFFLGVEFSVMEWEFVMLIDILEGLLFGYGVVCCLLEGVDGGDVCKVWGICGGKREGDGEGFG